MLVLDLDMQANLTSFFDTDISKHKRSKPDIDQVIRGGIDIRKLYIIQDLVTLIS